VRQTTKWNGWGEKNSWYNLSRSPQFTSYLEQALGITKADAIAYIPIEKIHVPPSKCSQEIIHQFEAICGKDCVCIASIDRIYSSIGKSYLDILRSRLGHVPFVTDVVVFPKSHDELEKILACCYEKNITVIPFGGGTTVLGGIDPLSRKKNEMVATINLKYMDRVLDIDRSSNLARVEAGILGPKLEDELSEHQYTFGHFPQSFEFSTLGGWIATRSSGQFSSKYGSIHHRVHSIKLVTPVGVMETVDAPATATGPSLKDIMIGSEGILGVMSEAVIKIQKKPKQMVFKSFYIKNVEDAVLAVREIVQSGLKPLLLRLSDSSETALFLKKGLDSASSIDRLKSHLGKLYFSARGFDFKNGVLLFMAFADDTISERTEQKVVEKIVSDYPSQSLGSTPSEKWFNERFRLPYLRDELIDRGILVDTLETAATWKNLLPLYHHVTDALKQSIIAMKLKPIVFCHLSHTYEDGASLYFTFLTKINQNDFEHQWHTIKDDATSVIMSHGGTLSHHHGIGRDHLKWLPREIGKNGMDVINCIKKTMDPKGLMNPGKLIGGL